MITGSDISYRYYSRRRESLTWAVIDSVQIALQRRLYIVAKYRELLLRKFLESHRAYFSFGQPCEINRCRDIVGPLVDIEEIPTGFRGLFQRGLNTNSFATFLGDCVEPSEEQVLPGDEFSSSDDSVVYRSPSLDVEPSVQTSPVVDITSVPIVSLVILREIQIFPCLLCIRVHTLILLYILIQRTFFRALQQLSNGFLYLLLLPLLRISMNSLHSFGLLFLSFLSRSCEQKAKLGLKTDTATLSIEMHEFKKAVRTQNAFISTDLADLRKEVKDLKAEFSKDFDDKLAVIHNDLLEFLVETQGQLSSLSTNLTELIAFVTKGRDDKNGEVDSSHDRGQPPP
ncbi:hypothetical protein F511_25891 [Dorcoceras hygrometricum]|uniref:Uncharacterized protein n=1 Tax=Dorcoceras hygrometricum TaxID=472368 RepID=A0A2Z7BR09_9LAMI|nr:hypothetical protein F511_25891 [Dorcoceras hygrometricum]